MNAMRSQLHGLHIPSDTQSTSDPARSGDQLLRPAPGKRSSPASLVFVTLTVLAVCTMLGMFVLSR
jgi:hypothetical protein